MKRTFFAIIVITLIAVVLLPDAFAQNRKFRKKEHRMERMHRLERLNLTDEQQKKVDEFRVSHQREMIDLRSELDKAKLDIRELKNKSDYKRSDLISAVEKLSAIKNKIAIAQTNHHMDIYELLDKNQKEVWNNFRPKRFDKPVKRIDKRMEDTE
ncbi:MAG: periplasmic heavy metal sensor [Ignavibacteriales bacterium]|nr:MAG: periplasmic heavy metal sensor [Ignavibacteriales bacterium]